MERDDDAVGVGSKALLTRHRCCRRALIATLASFPFWDGAGWSANRYVTAGDLPSAQMAATYVRPTRLPDLQIRSMGGDPVVLRSVAGAVALVNIFATWCFACRLEMPSLLSAAGTWPNTEVSMIAFGQDDSDIAPRLANTIRSKGVGLFTDQDRDVASRMSWLVSGRDIYLPTTLIVDRDGLIIAVVEEAADWSLARNSRLINRLGL